MWQLEILGTAHGARLGVANNERLVRGPKYYFIAGNILHMYYGTSGRSWHLSAI